jgi:arylformamidase
MCDTPKTATEVAWQGWNELPRKPPRTGNGAWTDLTYPLSPSVPRSAMFDPPKFTRIAQIPNQRANITQMDMVVHTGTHVDAPVHFCINGPGMEAIPLERLMGEGVVIRLELSACEPITADQLDAATPTIEPGDIVAIDTGWATRWETPDWTRHPYLSSEATDWIIKKHVKLVAVDTITPDLPSDLRPDDFEYPVHCELLQRGILIAEQVANLDRFSGQRVEFIFGALPIVDCDGAPSRVLARAVA